MRAVFTSVMDLATANSAFKLREVTAGAFFTVGILGQQLALLATRYNSQPMKCRVKGEGATVALRFDGGWRFDPPEDGRYRNKAIPGEAIGEFLAVIAKVATQGSRKAFLHFKGHFCAAVGATHVRSSSESWAETDLNVIEALFDACEDLRRRANCAEWFVPDETYINQILRKHDIGYEIRSPDLVLREREAHAVPVPQRPPTLAEQSVELFQKSLARSEQLLSEGRSREAVQEVLWLLETVTTAFRGVRTESGTVEGKYFNHIVRDLKTKRPGTTLDQVLTWVTSLHGYLSSPTGGGVRHGLDLNSGIELDQSHARLFCNLIRSYLSFLLSEHERLSKSDSRSVHARSVRAGI